MKAQSASQDYDYLFKVILIGDSCVGKAALLLKLSNQSFQLSNQFLPTIGVEFRIRTVQISQKTIKLQMWDTSGQQRFKTITNSYYKGAHAIILVYDITDISSFNNIKNWIAEIEKFANENVVKMLVGNCNNQQKSRMVGTQEGRALADSLGIKLFFETDRKDAINTQKFLFQMVKQVKLIAEMKWKKQQGKTENKQKEKKKNGFFSRIGEFFGPKEKGGDKQKLQTKDLPDIQKVGLSKKGVEILKQHELLTMELLLLATEDDLKEMNLPMGDRIIIRGLKK